MIITYPWVSIPHRRRNWVILRNIPSWFSSSIFVSIVDFSPAEDVGILLDSISAMVVERVNAGTRPALRISCSPNHHERYAFET